MSFQPFLLVENKRYFVKLLRVFGPFIESQGGLVLFGPQRSSDYLVVCTNHVVVASSFTLSRFVHGFEC